jgi:hypothetical protein
MRAMKMTFETTETAEGALTCSHCHWTIDAGQEIYAAAQWGTVRHADMDECRAGVESHGRAAGEALLQSLNASAASTGTLNRPRFTCPLCGDTRDTTRAGHCDTCEN